MSDARLRALKRLAQKDPAHMRYVYELERIASDDMRWQAALRGITADFTALYSWSVWHTRT